LVHTNGLGLSFHAAIQLRMSFSSACTLRWSLRAKQIVGEIGEPAFGAARAQHPSDLRPPHAGRVSARHHVKRVIGERKRRLVRIGNHDHAARMQPASR
jgi:hypothetical protein